MVQRRPGRSGWLWDVAFKSVLVEDGMASRTLAAYTDLNPVRDLQKGIG
jgi:hypothetical protein